MRSRVRDRSRGPCRLTKPQDARSTRRALELLMTRTGGCSAEGTTMPMARWASIHPRAASQKYGLRAPPCRRANRSHAAHHCSASLGSILRSRARLRIAASRTRSIVSANEQPLSQFGKAASKVANRGRRVSDRGSSNIVSRLMRTTQSVEHPWMYVGRYTSKAAPTVAGAVGDRSKAEWGQAFGQPAVLPCIWALDIAWVPP
jgi:hypothetical protein